MNESSSQTSATTTARSGSKPWRLKNSYGIRAYYDAATAIAEMRAHPRDSLTLWYAYSDAAYVRIDKREHRLEFVLRPRRTDSDYNVVGMALAGADAELDAVLGVGV